MAGVCVACVADHPAFRSFTINPALMVDVRYERLMAQIRGARVRRRVLMSGAAAADAHNERNNGLHVHPREKP